MPPPPPRTEQKSPARGRRRRCRDSVIAPRLWAAPGRDESNDSRTDTCTPLAGDPAWQAARAAPPRSYLPVPPTHTPTHHPRQKERTEQLCCWHSSGMIRYCSQRSDTTTTPIRRGSPCLRKGGHQCQDALQQAMEARRNSVGTEGAEMTKRSSGERSHTQRMCRFRQTLWKFSFSTSSGRHPEHRRQELSS